MNETYNRFYARQHDEAIERIESAGDLKTLAYQLYKHKEFLTYSVIKKFIKGRRYEMEARLDNLTER